MFAFDLTAKFAAAQYHRAHRPTALATVPVKAVSEPGVSNVAASVVINATTIPSERR